jgi:hypothetical protein
MLTGNLYVSGIAFLSRAQILIKKLFFISGMILLMRSCVKLAIPHFTGGKVLMKRILDCCADVVMQVDFIYNLKEGS